MKLYLPEVRLALGESEDLLHEKAAELLGVDTSVIESLEIRRKSLDTRHFKTIWWVYGLEIEVDATHVSPEMRVRYAHPPKRVLPAPRPPRPARVPPKPIVIVGAGPAGLFCAQRLADAGVPSIVIERGKSIRDRAQDTKRFRKGGALDPDSNIQFGEGGAGTYSDGKLTYRTGDPLAAYVLDIFVRYGAKPEIRYLSRPHIGTEHLRACIVRMSAALRGAGVQMLFSARMESLEFSGLAGEKRRLHAVRLASGETIETSSAVLALGHSARDTFTNLYAQGVPFIPKPFAVGVRAEHPQDVVDRAQYGRHAGTFGLPAASYALSHQFGRRGIYSFCMCPGGEVMGCSSEWGGVVTNGMSYSRQRSGYANAGLVVTVNPEDCGASLTDPFGGVRLQRELESTAFVVAGSNYFAPAQRIEDFLRRRTSGTIDRLCTTYRPGVAEVDLWSVLPRVVAEALLAALPAFARKIPGFASQEGILVGVETRTSSPVRIPRGDDLQALGWEGLYPVGEGAGYAGGIVSAAVDGVRAADAILARLAAR